MKKEGRGGGAVGPPPTSSKEYGGGSVLDFSKVEPKINPLPSSLFGVSESSEWSEVLRCGGVARPCGRCWRRSSGRGTWPCGGTPLSSTRWMSPTSRCAPERGGAEFGATACFLMLPFYIDLDQSAYYSSKRIFTQIRTFLCLCLKIF